MRRIQNLKGATFERLTVKYLAEERDHRGGARWICDCSCGVTDIIVDASNLIERNVKSCGCLRSQLYKGRQRTVSLEIERTLQNRIEKICEVCERPFIAGSKNGKKCPECFLKKRLGTKPSKDDW